jgi:pyruvate dehydrogenase E2 component (dihydrolipoamide acetyltransferase)
VRDFLLPSLGADMDAGTVVDWYVHPGDTVHRGDIVAVVATEKADIDVEVFADGVVDDILVPVGTKVPVGTPIARLRAIGEEAGAAGSGAAVVAAMVEPRVEPAAAPRAPREVASVTAVTSPLVRHLAERAGIDLTSVHGSGPGGRIVRADVEQRPELPGAQPPRRPVTPRARRLARHHGIDLAEILATTPTGVAITGSVVEAIADRRTAPDRRAATGRPTIVPPDGDGPSSMRQAIARVMARSWREIPHYHVGLRIDVERALRQLDAHNADRPASQRVLPAALLLHAVARAAARTPETNGWWRDDRFVAAEHVDLAVAVALRTGGLLTPVIRGADTLELPALMDALRDLVTRARLGRLRGSELGGASITVTNLGEQGADWVTGVIDPPQVALVGFGAVRAAPVVDDGAVVVHRTVEATVAGDHRASDGRRGAELLTLVARLLQEVPA